MRYHAFIFARGGSKGLPGKNIKMLLGKPLIQYSIEAALSTLEIDKIFVSTEDTNIAEIAKKNGAIVIDRPDNLATDCSPEWLSWQHAVNWVKNNYGEFDGFVSLPATSPLRSVNDIASAIQKRDDTNADVCVAVTPSSRSPYFNMVKELDDGTIEIVNKVNIDSISHRQDSPKVFDVTTVAYVTTVNFILNNNGIFDGSVTNVKVPKYRSVDIDDIYDFYFAESILLKNTINR